MTDAKLKKIIMSRGYKMTKQRRAILAVIGGEKESALTARQIYRRVRELCSGTNFSTIYRNLELLVDLGLLLAIPLEGSRTYVLVRDHGHQHHLICKGCGATRRIKVCPVKDLQPETLAGFTPTEHRFEVFGYCSRCQKKRPAGL